MPEHNLQHQMHHLIKHAESMHVQGVSSDSSCMSRVHGQQSNKVCGEEEIIAMTMHEPDIQMQPHMALPVPCIFLIYRCIATRDVEAHPVTLRV